MPVSRIIHGRYEKDELIKEDLISFYYVGKSIYTNVKVIIREFKNEALNKDVVSKIVEKIKLVAELVHPNILSLIDYSYTDTTFFLIYEFNEGEFLAESIADSKISIIEAVNIIQQAADVLRYAYQKGTYHGHLTDNHILHNSRGHIKIMDFVIDNIINEHALQRGRPIEDIAFIAPEKLIEFRTTQKSEVYSAGVLLYKILTNRNPYTTDIRINAMKKSILRQEPIPIKQANDQVPDYMEKIVYKAMEKESLARFKSLDELALSLKERKLQQPLEQIVNLEPVIEQTFRGDLEMVRKKRHRQLIYIGIGCILLGIFFGLSRLLLVRYFSAVPVVSVPNLVGMPLDEAQSTLRGQKLRMSISGRKASPEIPEGRVIDSNPHAGKFVRQGRMISILISDGTGTLLIPDLIGTTFESASKLTAERGLMITRGEDTFSRIYPPGAVITQDPLPSAIAGPQQEIKVGVSKGYPVNLEKLDLYSAKLTVSVLSDWNSQEITIKQKDGAQESAIFKGWLLPGEEKILLVNLKDNTIIEVYYNDKLAYSSKTI